MAETIVDWQRPHELHQGSPFLTSQSGRRQQPLTAREKATVYPVMIDDKQALGPNGGRRKTWVLEEEIGVFIFGLGDRRIRPYFIYTDEPTPQIVQQNLWQDTA